MAITLEQAFANVDNVVSEALMNRKQHSALIQSIQIIKEAVKPSKEDELAKEEIKEPVEEGDEEDGGTDECPND